jgi:glyoxylase-like metal-dependent hydrolase (beta-lactamase superfamily II)
MRIDRRNFLRLTLGAATNVFSEPAAWSVPDVEQIASGVSLIHGPVNGVLIDRHGETLAVYGDPREVPAAAVRTVLFTHHRRDVVWAGKELVGRGTRAVAPEAEKELFTGVATFWEQYRTKRFHDYANQSSRVLSEPLSVAATVRGVDTIEGIQVIDTPGYSRGAVSYLFESAGRESWLMVLWEGFVGMEARG